MPSGVPMSNGNKLTIAAVAALVTFFIFIAGYTLTEVREITHKLQDSYVPRTEVEARLRSIERGQDRILKKLDEIQGRDHS